MSKCVLVHIKKAYGKTTIIVPLIPNRCTNWRYAAPFGTFHKTEFQPHKLSQTVRLTKIKSFNVT